MNHEPHKLRPSIVFPYMTWRVKNIQKMAYKRRNHGERDPHGTSRASIYYTWPINQVHLTKQKTKTQHVSLGANSWNPYMKAIWRSIPNMSQLTVGIFGSTNSHTSRGVKNYPAIPQYNILRILYNIQHHSNHDLPINKTRTQFRKFSHFLTTPTYKSAPIFDHISPKSCKQATHHLFLGNQNAHVKYDVKNLHLPSDEKP